jgi:hypothetical protein
VNNFTNIKFRCTQGHEFEQKWSNVMFGRFCTECNKQKVLKEMEVVIDEFCGTNKWKRMGRFKSAKEKMDFKCTKCNMQVSRTWDSHRRSCPHDC